MQRAAEALRQIVQSEQPLAHGDSRQRGPIGWLPEQVHADQRAWPQVSGRAHLGNATFELGRIDLEGARIDIDEHRRRAKHQRYLGGRGIGEGWQEHRVAATHVLRHQRDLDRVGAGTHRNAMLCTTQHRQGCFQFRNLGAEDELAMGQHAIQPRAQVGGNTRLLRLQVEERHGGTRGIGHSGELA